MAEDCYESPPCMLNENGSLQLSNILRAFNAPISEEQAWAVCFQSAKCMANEWNSDSGSCYCLSNTAHVFIHKDGTIHRSTVRLSVVDEIQRKLASSEYALVASLGVIVFNALDYGLCHDEERKLSPPLECLIDRMTSATSVSLDDDDCDGDKSDVDDDQDSTSSLNADEGIEQDSGEDDHQHIIRYGDEDDDDNSSLDGKHKNGLTLVKVMEMCASHLSCPGQADCHFKAVCRALVAEALELSSFLENISTGKNNLPYSDDLEKLKIQDWARLWMQVIQQLRQGVKLKKVDPAHFAHPIEFELTPYEMLLDDIRSRRYKLRQVMVNGDIPPRVKKDAHALILEFIRSRPPLVPVSRRKLPPTPPRELTLYEKLMQSIRKQHKLKPTSNSEVETSRTKLEETDITPQPHRKLLKCDLSFHLSSFDDDETDLMTPSIEEPNSLPTKSNGKTIVRSLSHSGTTAADDPDRRHSISVCESLPKSRNQKLNNRSSPRLSRAARSDYWKSSQWQSLECLSLTLEEVIHIRSVLTRIELESLISDSVLYNDILKGKVCFTCKEIRFAFFGPWGIKCKMCERTVCDKCSSKMHIPTEHFARIPVYTLSPTPSPPPEEDSSQSSSWKLSDVFAFGSPTPSEKSSRPQLARQATIATHTLLPDQSKVKHSGSLDIINAESVKNSSCSTAQSRRRRSLLQRSKTIQESETLPKQNKSDKTKAPLVPVCRQCKVMVCNIVQASKDKISFDDRRNKNSKTWPQKKTPSTCMSPVAETPKSPPNEGFSSFPQIIRKRIDSCA